ncbi:hypothetical protein EIP86_001399 [Pleurotus ostreatoroseus]|nr:hypothetical protein EIP86_001399 [Pleurotus ostreatoroseus]
MQHQTTIRQSTTLVAETPTAKQETLRAPFQTDDHLRRTEAVCNDIKRVITEEPVSYFLEALLPPLHDNIDLAEVIHKLAEEGTLGGGSFTAFRVPPSKCHANENQVYRQILETLVGNIVEAARCDDAVPTLQFVHSGETAPRSMFKTNSTRPDSFALLVKYLSTPMWAHSGLIGEVKKKNTPSNRRDDDRKMAFNLAHCTNDDPRRRFALGFTIEDTEMRLWFCCREKVCVSEPFNFLTDYFTTVHFFLSVMFASPQELGWDPTIRLWHDPKKPSPEKGLQLDQQFDIDVRSEDGSIATYRTQERISDRKADALPGCGTRIWKVLPIDDEGEIIDSAQPLTLKDTWIHHDREREGDFHASLRSALSSTSSNDLDKFLLIIAKHGDVYVDGQPDNTRTLIMRGHPIPATSKRYIFERPDGPDRVVAKGSHVVQQLFGSGGYVKDTVALAHYRIVSEGVFKPLYELSELHHVFRALGQASYAISFMHALGWVHRDLNPTTLLIDESYTNVRLSGFDYAKRMQDDAATPVHPSRTPLEDFVAAEVASGAYIFNGNVEKETRVKSPVIPLANLVFASPACLKTTPPEDLSLTGAASQEGSSQTPPPFRYNPLHDLESYYWVAVYFMVYKITDINGSAVEPSEKQIELKRRFYYSSGETSWEKNAFLKTAFPVDCVHPALQPIAKDLEAIRVALVNTYTEAERDLWQIDHTTGKELAEDFSRKFLAISKRLIQTGTRISVQLPAYIRSSKPRRATKRKVQELVDDSDDSDYVPDDVDKDRSSPAPDDQLVCKVERRSKRRKL